MSRMRTGPSRRDRGAVWIAAAVLFLGAPTWACFTADRVRARFPHLTMEEAEKIAHGNHPRIHHPVVARGLTTCTDGMAGEFPCDNVDLLGHLPLSGLGGNTPEGADLWGWYDPIEEREYALFGRDDGTAFVDVTDPSNPVLVGDLPSAISTINLWRDVKTYGDYAYIVADNAGNHGLQVFDLTNLRTKNRCATLPCAFTSVTVYNRFSQAHNVVINEQTGSLFAVGLTGFADKSQVPPQTNCGGGLHMVDLSEPASPAFAGCFAVDGYTHDAQCIVYDGPDTEHLGKEICFASNEDTLTIVDVTDKAAPMQLSRTSYAGYDYTHQGWLTADRRYFVFDDEGDEGCIGCGNTKTLVMDVTDLDGPSFRGAHVADGTAIDHNQYVHSGHTYQANYTRGLRVLRLDDLDAASMTEVAFFDTYPNSDSISFNGAWSTYPFLPSGNVLVSDINRGLFILRVRLGQVFKDGFEAGSTVAWSKPDE